MWRFYHECMRFVEHLSAQDYLLLVLAGIVLGILCMRGFGSRSHY
jgi:hypothetical protein